MMNLYMSKTYIIIDGRIAQEIAQEATCMINSKEGGLSL